MDIFEKLYNEVTKAIPVKNKKVVGMKVQNIGGQRCRVIYYTDGAIDVMTP